MKKITKRWTNRVRKHMIYDFLYRRAGSKQLAELQNIPTRDQQHSYTQFLRMPTQVATLLDEALPIILAQPGKNNLNINIFGVSNGAEAYTVAAKIAEKYPGLDFIIQASDLDPQLIQKAREGRYTKTEVLARSRIPRDFVDHVFDTKESYFLVKPQIQKHCHFSTMNILSSSLGDTAPKADVVFAQNVLCHLTFDQIPLAFANIVATLAPLGILLIDGMPLDLRVKLTCDHNLYPLRKKIRAIHNEARSHIPEDWWNYYFGLEPFRFLHRDRDRRYGTIFLTQACAQRGEATRAQKSNSYRSVAATGAW